MLIESLKSVLVQREQVWESCPCCSNDGVWQLYRVIWKSHHKCETFHHEIHGSGTFDVNVKASLSESCFMWFLKPLTASGVTFQNCREIADAFCFAFEMDITRRCKSQSLHTLIKQCSIVRCLQKNITLWAVFRKAAAQPQTDLILCGN